MSKTKGSNEVKPGFTFDLSPEDFDKRLAAELQSIEAMSGSFRSFGSPNPPPIDKSQSRVPNQRPSQDEIFVPSSSSGYVVGKPVPGSVTMLPSKLMRHDDDFKRIHTAKTTVTSFSDPEFDADLMEQEYRDPMSDVNYNSLGNNVFVLSCNAVTSMPVVPREGADGKKLSTPQLRKQVNDRYAEVQSLFAPPSNLTQHDVDVLNITIEAKRYEEFYEASVIDPMEHINFSHEMTLQKHVERLKKPKVNVPFNATSPLPHLSQSAPTSLSPLRRKKKNSSKRQGKVDPFSDTESQGGGSINSSYASPLNQLKAHYLKAKSPRSPILTVDAFAEVADKMKEDIKFLVQDTIRSELMNMRKKQSRGGNIYVEPTTPNNKEGDNDSVRRQQQPQQQLQQVQRSQPGGRSVNTPDTLENIIEKKIESKLKQLNQELGALKGKPSAVNVAAGGVGAGGTTANAISPVKPPVGNGVSPKAAAAPNKGRKLKEDNSNNSNAKTSQMGDSGSVKFSERPENIPPYESPRSQSRRLSGASVTFSSDSPTPIMSAQPPYSSNYNRNFSITPGGSLIHSFIDEKSEYVGANEYNDINGGGSGVAAASGGLRRRSSGSKDFVAVSTPAGPNIFGTTPAANNARLSSPMFSSEIIPPHSPAAAAVALDNRASSPRATSRQMSAPDRAGGPSGFSPAQSAPTSNTSSYGNRSRPISQAAPPDHIDARATEVTIQVVNKVDSPSEKRKSSEVNPNIKVKIDGVVLEDSISGANGGGGGGGGRRKKSSGSAKSSPKAVSKKYAEASSAASVSSAKGPAAAASGERNDIELLLMQKLNEVLMAPVPPDVVQPPVVARSSKKLSIGAQQRQTQSRELVSSVVLAGTVSATNILAPGATSASSSPTAKTAAATAALEVSEAPEPVKSTVEPPAPVVVVQKPIIADTKNSTVAAIINGKPIPTKEVAVVIAPVKTEPAVVQEVAVKSSAPAAGAAVDKNPSSLNAAAASAAPVPVVTAPSAAPSTPLVPATVESIAGVRDAMKSAAGLGSRVKTSEIMAQYDNEQKREEEALLYGTGYGNDTIIQILKKFEKNDGVEVDMSTEEKLNEKEKEVLDGEYNELTKQIAQLSKIKSKIKKDLKTWVTDFETTQGRPPSTADKLTIEDRFLAYKTVVTEVEEAKRYSNKIADLLRASR